MVTIVPPASIFNKVLIPETQHHQQQFQDYVLQTLFPSPAYIPQSMQEKSMFDAHHWLQHGLQPQFFLKDQSTGTPFVVACKYRTGCIAHSFQLAQSLTLEHKCTQLVIPYFFVLGVGGTPDQPAQVFLINLQESQYLVLYKRHLKGKDIAANTHILPQLLWKK